MPRRASDSLTRVYTTNIFNEVLIFSVLLEIIDWSHAVGGGLGIIEKGRNNYKPLKSEYMPISSLILRQRNYHIGLINRL